MKRQVYKDDKILGGNFYFMHILNTSLLFLSILLISGNLQSQQQLEFNQVKLVSAQETVPNGKVWKIVNIYPKELFFIKHSENQGGSCSCGSGNAARKYKLFDYYSSYTIKGNVRINSDTLKYSGDNILWLPSGTDVETITVTTPLQISTPSTGCYNNYYIDGVYIGCGPYTPPQVTATPKLSVLEFNVTP